MPFDKFVDMETLSEERRKALQRIFAKHDRC